LTPIRALPKKKAKNSLHYPPTASLLRVIRPVLSRKRLQEDTALPLTATAWLVTSP